MIKIDWILICVETKLINKKYKLFDHKFDHLFNQAYFSSSNVTADTTVIVKD